MLKPIKLSAELTVLSTGGDRYVPEGYVDDLSVPDMFRIASNIEGMEGTQLCSVWHVNDETVPEIKALSEETGIKVIELIADIFTSRKWTRGSLSSRDPKIRQDAIDEVRKTLDWAQELDCPLVNVWPGQDGFDYPFGTDYITQWDLMVEGFTEIAAHQDRVRIGIEPKIKEPRKHIFTGTIGKTLHLVNEVNSPLLGIIVDVGHALAAYENMAMSVALAARNNSLFHLHLNDNHRLWDDDLYVASIHTIEFLELFYWLEKVGYDGYYALDICPYREDAVDSIEESFAWIHGLRRVLEEIGMDTIDELVKTGDHMALSKLIRNVMLP